MSITKNVQFQTQGPTLHLLVFISQFYFWVFDFLPKVFQTFIKTWNICLSWLIGLILFLMFTDCSINST